MPNILSIVWFVLLNALGFFTGTLILVLAVVLGFTPAAADPGAQALADAYRAGPLWAWLCGLIASLGYFYLKSRWRLLCLWAPFLVPLIYSLVILAYFS